MNFMAMFSTVSIGGIIPFITQGLPQIDYINSIKLSKNMKICDIQFPQRQLQNTNNFICIKISAL